MKKLNKGDRVSLKAAGTYRSQVLEAGHSGVVFGPCETMPTDEEWYWIFWDGQDEAIIMRGVELE